MAKGINKVILIGNLGSDPEVRYMPNGNAVTNLSLATSESWQDKQTGERQERTEWHRVILFKRLAEIAGEYLRKGSKVYIEGRLRTRKWTDQAGVERYTTEITADELQMLDRATGGREFNPTSSTQSNFAPDNYSGMDHGESAASKGHAAEPAKISDQFDDDIPF